MGEGFDLWVFTFCAIGQSLFWIMWVTLPWWREWIGRALFFKSTALMVLLDVEVLFAYFDWSNEDEIESVMFIGIALGIWAQTFALGHERWRASKGRREVSGTNHQHVDVPLP